MTRGYHHNWRKTSGVICDKRIDHNWRKTSGILRDKRIPSQLEEDVGGPMLQEDTITTGGRRRGSYVTRGYHHNWRKTSGVLCDKRIPSQLEEDVGGPM